MWDHKEAMKKKANWLTMKSQFKHSTCSTILCLKTWLRSRILMAKWCPVSIFLANFTLAKLPSPMVLPSSYFPTRVRDFEAFMFIFWVKVLNFEMGFGFELIKLCFFFCLWVVKICVEGLGLRRKKEGKWWLMRMDEEEDKCLCVVMSLCVCVSDACGAHVHAVGPTVFFSLKSFPLENVVLIQSLKKKIPLFSQKALFLL